MCRGMRISVNHKLPRLQTALRPRCWPLHLYMYNVWTCMYIYIYKCTCAYTHVWLRLYICVHVVFAGDIFSVHMLYMHMFPLPYSLMVWTLYCHLPMAWETCVSRGRQHQMTVIFTQLGRRCLHQAYCNHTIRLPLSRVAVIPCASPPPHGDSRSMRGQTVRETPTLSSMAEVRRALTQWGARQPHIVWMNTSWAQLWTPTGQRCRALKGKDCMTRQHHVGRQCILRLITWTITLHTPTHNRKGEFSDCQELEKWQLVYDSAGELIFVSLHTVHTVHVTRAHTYIHAGFYLGRGDQGMFPPQEDMFPPQNNMAK
jgi:hypothetical protein